MKRKYAARLALYIIFVLFIYLSPYNSGISGTEKFQVAIGGAILCFVSPLMGRWIAVHVFHCPEWDKEE